MMKNILLVGSSLAVGFFVGARFYDRRFNNRVDEQVNLEIEDYKRTHETLFAEREDVPDFVVGAMKSYQGAELLEVPSENLDPNFEYPMVPFADRERPMVEGSVKPPYVISFNEYDTTEVGYEKRVVTYYAGDKKVADEHDEPLSPQRTGRAISYNNLDKLEEGNENPIYVRCERYNMDFEVNMSLDSFKKVVLGEEDTEDSDSS